MKQTESYNTLTLRHWYWLQLINSKDHSTPYLPCAHQINWLTCLIRTIHPIIPNRKYMNIIHNQKLKKLLLLPSTIKIDPSSTSKTSNLKKAKIKQSKNCLLPRRKYLPKILCLSNLRLCWLSPRRSSDKDSSIDLILLFTGKPSIIYHHIKMNDSRHYHQANKW